MVQYEKRYCLKPYLGLDINVRGVVTSIRGIYKAGANQATLVTITNVKSPKSASIDINHLNFIIYNNDYQDKYTNLKLGNTVEVNGKVIQYPYRDSFGVKYKEINII